jgi:CheY-like chemotaxis protein
MAALTKPNRPTFDSPAPVPTKTILLVDDTDASRVPTKWLLNNFGYAVDTARSAEECLVLFNPTAHDLVVTDNDMPGMSGAEMAHIIKLRSPTTPVVMYAGTAPDDHSCLDEVLLRGSHILALKQAIERFVRNQTVVAP